MFDAQTRTASDAERSAAAAWQRPEDRFYKQVQAVLRNPRKTILPEVADVIEGLDSLLSRGNLTAEVEVWRGQRSSIHALGVSSRGLHGLINSTVEMRGYLATSVESSVAESVFAQPQGPGGAFMLHLIAPANTPAVWVPPLGRGDLADQYELLFGARRRIIVVDVDRTGSIPTVIGKLI